MTHGRFFPDNENDESSGGDDGVDLVATAASQTGKNSCDDPSLSPEPLKLLEINCTEDLSHFISKADVTELICLGNQEKPPSKGDWIDISNEANNLHPKATMDGAHQDMHKLTEKNKMLENKPCKQNIHC